jgi:hydroxypyruvate isomerase
MIAVPRQSFAWWCFANHGVEDAALLAQAARIGYRGVDLAGESLWPIARDRGLQIVAVAGHQSIAEGMNRPEHADRIVDEVNRRLEQAVEWQIPVLICFAGNRAGLDDESGLRQCAETLSRLAGQAEQAGVVLALELLNSRVDHPDYQFDRLSWGVRLCEEAGSPAVKILCDLYHLQIMEGDVIRRLQQAAPHIAHYHTAGNPGRGEPDDSQELNYRAIYRAISATGYSGSIAHEFLPQGDPVAALERTYETCRDAWMPPEKQLPEGGPFLQVISK